jgi:hypothetical protein
VEWVVGEQIAASLHSNNAAQRSVELVAFAARIYFTTESRSAVSRFAKFGKKRGDSNEFLF